MNSSTYTRYELLRNFRSYRFFILSLAIPVVLYLAVAGSQRHARFDGTAFPLNYLSAAIAKAGARNRAEAVRRADEQGWL
jgi:hypothetical protein